MALLQFSGSPWAASFNLGYRVERLVTLTSDGPERIRRAALRTLMTTVGAEIGLFYRAVRHQGRPVLCDVFSENSAQLNQVMAHFVSTGPPAGAACDESSVSVRARRGGWTLGAPPPKAHQRFARLLADFQSPDAFAALPVYAQLYEPLRVVDQLRLLTYQDGAFAGWIGVMRRRGSPAFTSREQRLANGLVRSTQRALTSAVALASVGIAGPLHAVFDGAGELDCASPELANWLTLDRLGLLKRVVRDLDANEANEKGNGQLDGVGIRWTRLASRSKVRYLAVVQESESIRRLYPRTLTHVELEVARAAARGLKIKDIAAKREVSINTVKFHLRNAYAKLDVTSRVELARALDKTHS